MNTSTLSAMMRALRWMYILITLVAALTFLLPRLGWLDYFEESLGAKRTVEIAVGWGLLGLLIEHLRSTVLRSRQAYLAQALLRISPNLKRLEAARILVRALDSEDSSVVETAHAELKRLTQVDHGTDSAAWTKWLDQELKKEGQPPQS